MSNADTGQVSSSAAEIYEEFFIPALFQDWPPQLIEKADIQAGQRVLDVACGTGILARTAAEHVGPGGSVAGLDINAGMLAVARRKSDQIEWRQGQAEALPYEDASFDAVVSQFGLMFFEDRRQAISEMLRVLRPGGRLAVAVWDSLENTPGYAAMVALLAQLFGDEAADGLRAPYNLGDKSLLTRLFEDSGLLDRKIDTVNSTARFPSIEAWVNTDIKGWVMSEQFSDEEIARLVSAAEDSLGQYVTPAGSVAFTAPGHIVSGQKPG